MRFVIMAKFLSPLFLLVLVQLSTCQEAPNCSALEVPYSGLPFSGEYDAVHLKLLELKH